MFGDIYITQNKRLISKKISFYHIQTLINEYKALITGDAFRSDLAYKDTDETDIICKHCEIEKYLYKTKIDLFR